MTENKPTMIDGVDVSECIFYQANFEEDFDVKINHFCSNWHNSCESVNNNNCYFKQLARKTQECEELKNIINEAKNSGLDFKSFLLSEAIQKEYEEQMDKLKADKEQAEQKLEKIHKLLTTCKKNFDAPCALCEYSKQCEKEDTDTQILKIIDEVE